VVDLFVFRAQRPACCVCGIRPSDGKAGVARSERIETAKHSGAHILPRVRGTWCGCNAPGHSVGKLDVAFGRSVRDSE